MLTGSIDFGSMLDHPPHGVSGSSRSTRATGAAKDGCWERRQGEPLFDSGGRDQGIMLVEAGCKPLVLAWSLARASLWRYGMEKDMDEMGPQ